MKIFKMPQACLLLGISFCLMCIASGEEADLKVIFLLFGCTFTILGVSGLGKTKVNSI